MMTSFLPNDLSLQTVREFQFLLSYTIQVSAHIHMPSPNTSSTVFIIRPERTQSSSFWQRTQWVIPSVYARRNRPFSFLAVMQPIIESCTSHNFSYLLLLQARLVMSTSRLCIPYAIIDAIRFSTSFSCYTSVVHSRIPCCILLCPYWALCIPSFPFFFRVLCNPLFYVWVLCNPFILSLGTM